jgi:hypothetical protein
VSPRTFRELEALLAANWRASSCAVKAKNEERKKKLQDQLGESIKGIRDF